MRYILQGFVAGLATLTLLVLDVPTLLAFAIPAFLYVLAAACKAVYDERHQTLETEDHR